MHFSPELLGAGAGASRQRRECPHPVPALGNIRSESGASRGAGGRADRRTGGQRSRPSRRRRNAVGQGRENGGGVPVNRIGRSRRRLDAGREATSQRPAGGGGAEGAIGVPLFGSHRGLAVPSAAADEAYEGEGAGQLHGTMRASSINRTRLLDRGMRTIVTGDVITASTAHCWSGEIVLTSTVIAPSFEDTRWIEIS